MFGEAKLRTSQAVSILEIERGDYSDIGCTEKDIQNALQKEKDSEKAYDAQILLELFEEKKVCNPSFYFEYKIDDENKLTHLFWVDGIARKDYKHFGDVLVFDTTYGTNKYAMIFAPFTGVNNHGQSCNFGVAFLKDEKLDSFLWIFETWKRAMGEDAPRVIIIDQNPVMTAAINIALPTTIHQYCM